MPFGIEKLYKSQKCSSEISGLLAVSRQYVKNLVETRTKPTAEDFIEYLTELSIQTVTLSTCYLGNSNYITNIIGFANKRLSVAEDIGEIILFSKDFFLSNISGKETRYFDNSISYGLLEYTNISDLEFSGKKDEPFRYESLVEETEIKYAVDRPITGSTFTAEENKIKAEGIPFQVALNSGDAILNGSNPLISDENGKVVLNGSFGEQDSEIEILPVNINPNIDPININLISNVDSDFSIRGTAWRMCATGVIQEPSCVHIGVDCESSNRIYFNEDNTITINGTPQLDTPYSLTSSYSVDGNTIQFNYNFSISTEAEISEQLVEGGIVIRTQTLTYIFTGSLDSSNSINGNLSVTNNTVSNFDPYNNQCSASHQVALSPL